MKYQISYNRNLHDLTSDPIYIEETEEIIMGIGFHILCLREYDDNKPYPNGETNFINENLRVSYDNITKKFDFFSDENLESMYKVVDYYKCVNIGYDNEFNLEIEQAEIIPKREFDLIIEKYGHLFESVKSLTHDSYGVNRIEESIAEKTKHMQYQLEEFRFLTFEPISVEEKEKYVTGISLRLRFSNVYEHDSKGIIYLNDSNKNIKDFNLTVGKTILLYDKRTKSLKYMSDDISESMYEVVEYAKFVADDKDLRLAEGENIDISKGEFDLILDKVSEVYGDDFLSEWETGHIDYKVL